jgi:hypothetical protein
VKDPNPVFDWTRQNVPAHALVRQTARGVNYDAMSRGALIATCPSEDDRFGWMVTTVLKEREIAQQFVSTWKPQVERCHFTEAGQ